MFAPERMELASFSGEPLQQPGVDPVRLGVRIRVILAVVEKRIGQGRIQTVVIVELFRPVDAAPPPREAGVGDGKNFRRRIIPATEPGQLFSFEISVKKAQGVDVDPASRVCDQAERFPGGVEKAAHPFQEFALFDNPARRIGVETDVFRPAAAITVKRVGVTPRQAQSVAHQTGDAGFPDQSPVVVELKVAFRPALACGKTVFTVKAVITPRRRNGQIAAERGHFRSVFLKPLAAIQRQHLILFGQLPDLFRNIGGFRQVEITVPAAPAFPYPGHPRADGAFRIRFCRSGLKKETEYFPFPRKLAARIDKAEDEGIAGGVLPQLHLMTPVFGMERRKVETEIDAFFLIPRPERACRSAVSGAGQIAGILHQVAGHQVSGNAGSEGNLKRQRFHIPQVVSGKFQLVLHQTVVIDFVARLHPKSVSRRKACRNPDLKTVGPDSRSPAVKLQRLSVPNDAEDRGLRQQWGAGPFPADGVRKTVRSDFQLLVHQPDDVALHLRERPRRRNFPIDVLRTGIRAEPLGGFDGRECLFPAENNGSGSVPKNQSSLPFRLAPRLEFADHQRLTIPPLKLLNRFRKTGEFQLRGQFRLLASADSRHNRTTQRAVMQFGMEFFLLREGRVAERLPGRRFFGPLRQQIELAERHRDVSAESRQMPARHLRRPKTEYIGQDFFTFDGGEPATGKRNPHFNLPLSVCITGYGGIEQGIFQRRLIELTLARIQGIDKIKVIEIRSAGFAVQSSGITAHVYFIARFQARVRNAQHQLERIVVFKKKVVPRAQICLRAARIALESTNGYIQVLVVVLQVDFAFFHGKGRISRELHFPEDGRVAPFPRRHCPVDHRYRFGVGNIRRRRRTAQQGEQTKRSFDQNFIHRISPGLSAASCNSRLPDRYNRPRVHPGRSGFREWHAGRAFACQRYSPRASRG